jgi:integrase
MNALTIASPVYNDISSMIDCHPRLADTTKIQYKKALRNYLETGKSLSDSQSLKEYALTLKKSSRSFLKAAVKLWTEHLKDEVQSQATPDNILAVIATEKRLEALNRSIHAEQSKGEKAHFWLTQSQVKQLLNACPDDIYGKRDKVVLGLLVGAGLRREELASLTFDSVTRQGERVVLDVHGKGAKDRVVPISAKLANLLEEWHKIAGNGFIVRSLGMNRELGESLSPVQIFRIVRRYGEKIGVPQLAAHDLRRTFAQIGLDSGISIVQISVLLGHSSIAVTQRYLNIELDLKVSISDFVPM